MGYGAVKFNLASAAADDIYLSLVQDSVIAGAKGAEKALELRLVEGAEITTDTVYYGAQALGDTLVRVAYALEQAYDAEGRLAHEAVGGVEVVKLSKKPAYKISVSSLWQVLLKILTRSLKQRLLITIYSH